MFDLELVCYESVLAGLVSREYWQQYILITTSDQVEKEPTLGPTNIAEEPIEDLDAPNFN